MNVFKRKRRGPDGKLVIAKTYSARHRFPGDRQPTTIPLHVTLKDVAEKLGRDWVKKEERRRAGLLHDPDELEAADASLSTLVDEFADSMRARGLDPDYARKPIQRCRSLFKLLGWRRIADANPAELRKQLEKSAWSATTKNHYLDAALQFFKWLQRDGRIPRVPIEGVQRFNTTNAETYDRAAFTEDELRQLIDPDTTDHRRLYRADVYAFMVFSGLRWIEARRLQVRDIRRDEDGYTVMIPRSKDKMRRGDLVELPDELSPVLDRLMGERQLDAKLLYAGCPTRHTFRRDCERAGIERERSDGSRLVRYSSRDTYTSLLRVLARSGDQVRALTRHHTRGMEERYTDRKTQGLRSLVNKMPVVVRRDPETSVHTGVQPALAVALSGNIRGFDSPRLHS